MGKRRLRGAQPPFGDRHLLVNSPDGNSSRGHLSGALKAHNPRACRTTVRSRSPLRNQRIRAGEMRRRQPSTSTRSTVPTISRLHLKDGSKAAVVESQPEEPTQRPCPFPDTSPTQGLFNRPPSMRTRVNPKMFTRFLDLRTTR